MTTTTRKQQVQDLLKSTETGAQEPVAVIDPNRTPSTTWRWRTGRPSEDKPHRDSKVTDGC